MKKEIQTKRRISLADSWAEYAKTISPNGTTSDGIRVALKFYKDNYKVVSRTVTYEKIGSDE